MSQNQNIPQSFINNLPNGSALERLIDEAQQQTPDKPIQFFDISYYPERDLPTGYGRYENTPAKHRIWLKSDLPDYMTEYVIAHELAHLIQETQGYPHISIRDKLRQFKVWDDEKQQYLYPEIIVRFHMLANGLSNILLDPLALATCFISPTTEQTIQSRILMKC